LLESFFMGIKPLNFVMSDFIVSPLTGSIGQSSSVKRSSDGELMTHTV
jgi:hypothetical protein